MTNSGNLFEKFDFQGPVETLNGYGGVIQGWSDPVSVRASIQYLRGGETVQAARLQGRQPAVLRVRNSQTLRLVDPSWRVTNSRTGVVYNIRSVVRSDDRRWLEFTVESGVPE
jgi:head-tail adaptor